jgi:Type IV secretion system pilin
MKNWKSLLAGAAIAVVPFVSAAPVFATDLDLSTSLEDVGDETGLEGGADQLPTTIGTLINAALGLLGIVFLLLTLYAGWLWMTAAGDPKKTDKARDILITAVVGLVILLSAYAISSFIIDQIQGAVTSA